MLGINISAFQINKARWMRSSSQTPPSPNQKTGRGDIHRESRGVDRNQSDPDRDSFVVGTIINLLSLLIRAILWGLLGIVVFFALYYLVANPPLHWFYETGESAGPASVYLPGSGFPGFWFHLGYLHSFADRHDLYDYDYYCFSASCLTILSAFLNRSMEEVYDTALVSQNAWISGNVSRFEIVEHFFDEIFPPDDDGGLSKNLEKLLSHDDHGGPRTSESRGGCLWDSESGTCSRRNFLPRIKVLITTLSDGGYKVVESRNRNELKENILATTWVPYLTGWGFLVPTDERDAKNEQFGYLDGGFSRTLHPKCEAEWNVPFMWETLVHTFSVGMSREQVQTLWKKGWDYEYPVPASSKTRTNATTNATTNAWLDAPRSP